MNKGYSFSSERLIYRGIQEEDAVILARWRSTPELTRYFGNPQPVTERQHLEWYNRQYLTDSARYDFLICHRITKSAVGTVGVKSWDRERRQCEISYMIAEPAYQRQGLAREAVAAMMEQMVQSGVKTFLAVIHQDNAPSARTVEGIGFVRGTRLDQSFWLYRLEVR